MKVSLLDMEQPGVFTRYLPDPMPPAGAGVRRVLALHQDGVAWGAAVVEVGDRAVDIVSLLYDPSAPKGACERALTQALTQRAADSTIREIVCVRQGTQAELIETDDRMLAAGYFPRAGGVQTMQAVLGDMLRQPAAQRLMAAEVPAGIQPLASVPQTYLRVYNQAHPAGAIRPEEADPATSRCYVDEGAVQAVLLTSRFGDMCRVDWLWNASPNRAVVGWLMGAALRAAAQTYPPETRITLAASAGSAADFAASLGFAPVSGDLSTRIYTYYLD